MKFTDFIRYRFKYNPVIRALSKPYMILNGRRMLREYEGTKYSKTMNSYENRYLGKRCFIIGNGPSLSIADLNMLKEEYTFGANRIYEIFEETEWRPTFYTASDGNFIKDNYWKILSYGMNPCFLEYRAIRKKDVFHSVIGICREANFAINRWDDRTIHVSEDLSKYFSDGYTVTFTSIQLAMYMGFKKIYLLGVDFSYSVVRDYRGKIHTESNVQDYFNGRHDVSTNQNYSSTLRAYQVAEQYSREHGIVIKNATRGGKLEVFERVNFDDLFEEKNKILP